MIVDRVEPHLGDEIGMIRVFVGDEPEPSAHSFAVSHHHRSLQFPEELEMSSQDVVVDCTREAADVDLERSMEI